MMEINKNFREFRAFSRRNSPWSSLKDSPRSTRSSLKDGPRRTLITRKKDKGKREKQYVEDTKDKERKLTGT
ncbi:MAG: hypothetical protein COT45_02480 [bacterium (Candidatus Stahlbacteria) CG08_land_8_20_14_0_20_40_26]|nr:MAG: hypothetical protein COX49_03595 [bacterium (Candidatus Stahlbacteria) CG23_combo_of_CG06-09_8_20_14_all_40_9]PIS25456.1 MAG: hypothetical protein COT45_02480 [bacterium (Candidatus Stahlbacteria) CG08_land_8_20_14_0_20_40_26]